MYLWDMLSAEEYEEAIEVLISTVTSDDIKYMMKNDKKELAE